MSNTEASRSSRILKTAGALVSVQGVTWLSSLISVTVLPRYLGAEHFGTIATAWTAVALLGLVAGFGTGNLVTKETARDPLSARGLAVHAALLQGLLWLCLSAIAAPALVIFVDSAVFFTVLVLSGITGLMGLWQATALSGLQGLERLGKTSLLLGLLSLTGNGLAFLVLRLGGGIIEVMVASSFVGATGLCVSWGMFLRVSAGLLRPSWSQLRRMLMAGPPYLAWDLGQKVYASIDLLILSVLAGAASVGAYAFAYRLIGIPVFATTIITMSVYPSLSAAAGTDDSWFSRVVSNSARLCLVVTAPVAIGIAVLAPEFVHLLSGGGFSNASVLVVILALHIPPAAVHTILGMALFARDMQRKMAMLAWVAAGLNVAANLVMIPLSERWWGNGATGAALVTLFSELAMGLLVWRWAWGFLDRGLVLGGLMRTSAACVFMAGTVAAVNWTAGLPFAVPAGLISYTLAITLLGGISIRELREFTAHALKSGRGAESPPEPASISP